MRLVALLAGLWVALGSCAAQHVRVADRVFLVPDRPGTTTRFEMIVNAGSSDEAGGEVRGVAHYLEHLILVGRNAQHGDAAIRMFADASSNGWTNDRATAFLHTLPARPDGGAADLEKLFAFYAARLRDFSISDADAARERNVVLQEHDLRIQSNPASRFYRDFNRALIPDHPAGAWTIGTRDSIRAMTLEDARAFHARWYVPANVWFVVRGDLAPDVVRAIAERTLGRGEAGGGADAAIPGRIRDRQPSLDGPTPDFVMRSDDMARPLVAVARMVRIDESDRIRSQAMVSLLSAYANSRFPGSGYDQLVEVQRVAADDLSISIRRVAPATFAVSLAASVAVDRRPEDLRAAMAGYLDRLAGEGVPGEAHLARLKKRLLDQWERSGRQPVQAQARLVAWLADGRDPERIAQWPDVIESVGTGDLGRLAVGLGAPGRQIAGVLEPEAATR